MKKEIVTTAISQILIVLFNFFSYKLILIFFGKNAFLDFSLIKRVLTFLYPLSTLGMGVAIPRFISLNREDISKIFLIIISALWLIFMFNILVVSILFIFDEILAESVIKNTYFVEYTVPISLMIISYSIFLILLGFFRGLYKIQIANIIQVVFLVGLPLVMIFISLNLKSYLVLTSIFSILFGIGCLLFIYNRYFRNLNVRPLFTNTSKELFIYGIQRIPADVGLSLIFLLPVLFYSSQYGYEEGGYLAFAMSLFSLLGMVFSPLNFVILPKAGILVAEGRFDILKKYFYKIIFVSFLYSTLILILFYSIGLKLLSIYIGELATEVYSLLKYIIFGVYGYTIFVSLRGIIDAVFDRSVNSIIIITSILIVTFIANFARFDFLFITFLNMGILGIIFLWRYFAKNA